MTTQTRDVPTHALTNAPVKIKEKEKSWHKLPSYIWSARKLRLLVVGGRANGQTNERTHEKQQHTDDHLVGIAWVRAIIGTSTIPISLNNNNGTREVARHAWLFDDPLLSMCVGTRARNVVIKTSSFFPREAKQKTEPPVPPVFFLFHFPDGTLLLFIQQWRALCIV